MARPRVDAETALEMARAGVKPEQIGDVDIRDQVYGVLNDPDLSPAERLEAATALSQSGGAGGPAGDELRSTYRAPGAGQAAVGAVGVLGTMKKSDFRLPSFGGSGGPGEGSPGFDVVFSDAKRGFALVRGIGEGWGERGSDPTTRKIQVGDYLPGGLAVTDITSGGIQVIPESEDEFAPPGDEYVIPLGGKTQVYKPQPKPSDPEKWTAADMQAWSMKAKAEMMEKAEEASATIFSATISGDEADEAGASFEAGDINYEEYIESLGLPPAGPGQKLTQYRDPEGNITSSLNTPLPTPKQTDQQREAYFELMGEYPPGEGGPAEAHAAVLPWDEPEMREPRPAVAESLREKIARYDRALGEKLFPFIYSEEAGRRRDAAMSEFERGASRLQSGTLSELRGHPQYQRQFQDTIKMFRDAPELPELGESPLGEISTGRDVSVAERASRLASYEGLSWMHQKRDEIRRDIESGHNFRRVPGGPRKWPFERIHQPEISADKMTWEMLDAIRKGEIGIQPEISADKMTWEMLDAIRKGEIGIQPARSAGVWGISDFTIPWDAPELRVPTPEQREIDDKKLEEAMWFETEGGRVLTGDEGEGGPEEDKAELQRVMETMEGEEEPWYQGPKDWATRQALQVGEGVRRTGEWVEGQAKEFAEDPGGYYTEKIYPPGRIAGAVERMDEGESFSEATGAQDVLAASSVADPTLASDVGSATLYLLEGDTESARNVMLFAVGGLGAGALAAKLYKMRKAAKAKALASGASVEDAERVSAEVVELAETTPPKPKISPELAERIAEQERKWVEWENTVLTDKYPPKPKPELAPEYEFGRESWRDHFATEEEWLEHLGVDAPVRPMDPDDIRRGLHKGYGDPPPAVRTAFRDQQRVSEDIYDRAGRVEAGPGQKRLDVDYEPPSLRERRIEYERLPEGHPDMPPGGQTSWTDFGGISRTPPGDWPPGMEYEKFVGAPGRDPLPGPQLRGSQITPPPQSTLTTARIMHDSKMWWRSELDKAKRRLGEHRALGAKGDPDVEIQLMQDIDEIEESLWEYGP